MTEKQSQTLQRSVDILTERLRNVDSVIEHVQKQNEALMRKLDVILSQISQNSIENLESHFELKVSFKNKINASFNALKEHHDADISCIKNNPMVRLGESRKFLTIIGFIILVAFWQNVEGIVTRLAKSHGVEFPENKYAIPAKSLKEQMEKSTETE
jgi:hypothetical protein